jgi:hypothetical protein
MTRAWVWIGRAVLGAVLVFAVLGVIDPAQRLAAVNLRGDRFNHGLLSYAITIGLIASFPRAQAWLLALAVLAIGGALELAQSMGFFAGDGQVGDILADLVGVLMALGPALLGKARLKVQLRRRRPD